MSAGYGRRPAPSRVWKGKNGRNDSRHTPRTRSNHAAAAGQDANYTAPLAVLTTLFFMWGFLTCLNDIIIPHLKAVFELSYAKAMLIQFAFFTRLLRDVAAVGEDRHAASATRTGS